MKTGEEIPEISPSTIPLIIGVAGHREILPAARGDLEKEVRAVFNKFRDEHPSTPLAVLTALEYGADRLVAQQAIDMDIPFYVVLPWPIEGGSSPRPYAGGDDGSVELKKLLSQAAGTITMADSRPDGVEKPEDDPWELAGAFVVRHCQVLVALWDGDKTRDTGTARMIQWQWEGHRTLFNAPPGPLDRPEGGPVFHITTPRDENSPPFVDVKERYQRSFDDKKKERAAKQHFEAIWRDFDRYNASIRGLKPAAIEKSRNYLMPERRLGLLTESEKFLLECFSRADAAASCKQWWTNFAVTALFILAGVAFVSVEFYAHLSHRPWQLGAYLVLLLTALGVYGVSVKRCHQEAYLDYRALAEALRVSVFWSVAGLTDTIADHYLRQFRSELDWIRQAARNCSTLARMMEKPLSMAQRDRFDLIKAQWIEDQLGFFGKRKGSKHDMHWVLETAQLALFLFGLMVAAVALMTHLCYGKEDHLLLVIMFGSAVLAAMITEWNEKMGYAVDARRYQAAHAVFETAHGRIASNPSDQDVRTIVRELGVEALSENADWVIQHRHRPIGVPNA